MEELKETQTKLKELYEAALSLQLDKNSKYGNSALEPLGIFDTKAHEETSPELVPLARRLDEKLSRIKNSPEFRTNDLVDTVGYIFLLLIKKGVSASDILSLAD